MSISAHWRLCGCLLCGALSVFHEFVGHLLWFSNIEAHLLHNTHHPSSASTISAVGRRPMQNLAIHYYCSGRLPTK